MEWMLMPYRRYADFSGRSGRKEYWMFQLFFVVVTIVAVILTVAGGTSGFHPGNVPPRPLSLLGFGLIALFFLGTFIPGLAVQVRRFHDQDKSGWFILLGLIPYVGALVVLIFMVLEGTRGPNRFGPDPRDPYNAEVFG